jgi:hypothetical protein
MHLPLRALAIAAAATAAAAVASAAAPPKAHEHGVARLDISADPGRISIDLDAPLDSLIGFERAARSDAERERVAAALARLRAADTLFRIDPGAGCKLARAELVAPVLELGPPDAAAGKDGHADLQGHYEFRCSAGARAGAVEVGLFEAFAALKRIELDVVTPKGRLNATLVRPASRVVLAR